MAIGDIGAALPLDTLYLNEAHVDVKGFFRVTDDLVIVLHQTVWGVEGARGLWVATVSVDGAGDMDFIENELLTSWPSNSTSMSYAAKGNAITLVEGDMYAVSYSEDDGSSGSQDDKAHRMWVHTFSVDPDTGEIDTVLGGDTRTSAYFIDDDEPPNRLIVTIDGILLNGVDHSNGAKQVVTLVTIHLKYSATFYTAILSWQIDVDGSIAPAYAEGMVVGYELAWIEEYATHIVYSARYRTHMRFQHFGQTNTIMIEYREYDQPNDKSLYHGVRMFSIGADGQLASGVTDFAELFIGYDWNGKGGYADSCWGVLYQLAPNNYMFYDQGYVHNMMIYENGAVSYIGEDSVFSADGPTNFVYIGDDADGKAVFAAYNRYGGNTCLITFSADDEGATYIDAEYGIFTDDEPPWQIAYQRSGVILSQDNDNGGYFVSHGVETGDITIQYWEELLGIITAIKHRWNPGEFTMEVLCGGVEDEWIVKPLKPALKVQDVITPKAPGEGAPVWKARGPGQTSPFPAPTPTTIFPATTTTFPAHHANIAPLTVSRTPAWVEHVKLGKSEIVPMDAPGGILDTREAELRRKYSYLYRRK